MSFDGSGSSSNGGPRGVGSSAARPDSPTLPPSSIPEGKQRLFDEVTGEDDYHTTINDDEEPQAEESLQEAIDTTIQSPTISEPETVLLIQSRSRSPHAPTEPFPELNDSEAHPPPDEYWAQERAYDYALGKVAAEDRRYREINDCIAALRGSLSAVEEDSTHSMALEGVHPCPEVTHYDHFCVQHETHKQKLFTNVTDFLNSNDELPDTFRRRFLLISTMISDMEDIFFRGKEFPSDPIRLVSIDELNETLQHAREIHQEVVDVNFLINHEKENAERTRYYVAQVAAERGLTLVDRFQRMSLLVTHYLKRVRHAEQSFFELFLQFYDVYFFEDFHIMYNNFRVEQGMHGIPRRLQQTSHTLTAIYQTLALMAQDYKELGQINADIGKTYLTPVLKELSHEPCICTDIFDCTPSAAEDQDREAPPHHHHCPRNDTKETESQRGLASSGDGSSAGPQTYLTRHIFAQWLSCEVPPEPHSELRRVESTQISTPPSDENHTQSDRVGLAGQPAIVQPIEGHDLHSHGAGHDQEISSHASERITAQASSFEDESPQHYQSHSFQESGTDCSVDRTMSSTGFANYYARVNHANQNGQSDLSHTSIEPQAVGYSPYDVPLPNGLPTIEQIQQLEGDIFRRLHLPNVLNDSSHTLAESQEENSPEHALVPEQSLKSEFDFLDLNSSDDDWLPYDHDADSPDEDEASFDYDARSRDAGMALFDMDPTTFGNRLEQMASSYIYENNNYSQPRLPADFRFRDETITSSTPVHYNAENPRDFSAPNVFDDHAHYRHNLESGPVFGYTEAHGSSEVARPGLPQDESGLRNGGILRDDGTYSPLLPPYTEAAPESRYVSRHVHFYVSRLGRRGARYSWRR